MKQSVARAMLKMGTLVRIHVATSRQVDEVEAAIDKSFAIFTQVELACSRFDELSELRQLCKITRKPIPVSDILFQALRFAWEVAEATDGMFDPTVGVSMEHLGFNRHYLSGDTVSSDATREVTYRDVVLDAEQQTVLLNKPMQLDLGAVAKGLAVDLAVRELADFEGCLINAGGDLYASGVDEQDEAWLVGIQHPFDPHRIISQVRIRDQAVCTSGSYERPSPIQPDAHHIIHPMTRKSTPGLVSCTVVAPFAMLADAFSTASFVYGVQDGLALLEANELAGLMITDDLTFYPTQDFAEYQF